MDQELQNYLAENFAAVRGEIAEVRGEVAMLRGEVREEFVRIREEFVVVRSEIRDTETKLLKAFRGSPRSMEIRQRGVTASVTGFDERLSLVEERISELERRRLN